MSFKIGETLCLRTTANEWVRGKLVGESPTRYEFALRQGSYLVDKSQIIEIGPTISPIPKGRYYLE